MAPPPAKKSAILYLLSVLLPGAGQALLGRRSRGLVIFVSALTLIGLPIWNGTPALLAGAVLFWVWNVWDAWRVSKGATASPSAGVVLVACVVLSVSWQQTNVNYSRLKDTRAMLSVLSRLVQPDVLTRSVHEQVGNLKLEIPCPVPNPAPATPVPGKPSLVANFGCRKAGESLVLSGTGFMAGAHGRLIWTSPIGDEQFLRNEGQVIDVVPDQAGNFAVTVEVPVAIPIGQDPNTVQTHQVRAEFSQPYGPWHTSEIFDAVASKMLETILIALLATVGAILLAIPLSFLAARNIMGRTKRGLAIYYGMRFIFNITRAIDPLIWGLIFIVWVGQGSFAGVLALLLHSIAALGKLYSEEIEHIDPGPVEAVRASGATMLQVIRYAVWPQVIPSFLGYTLLRWDTNVRMATVLGFVAGGGIGFLLVQFVRLGAYNQYATAMWGIAAVVLVLDFLSARWRDMILHQSTQVSALAPRPWYRSWRNCLFAGAFVALLAYSWSVLDIQPFRLLWGIENAYKLARDFVLVDLSGSTVATVAGLMLQTILMALLATVIGALLAVPFSFLAANNLTGRSQGFRWVYYVTRSFLNLARSIEALVYVGIFIAWVSIGPFAGMMALAMTTFALLGKLFSEAIENIEAGPLEAINSTGANRLQVIVYGVIPQIIPPFVSYAIYQWDINIRMSTIVGFAGGGGIGFQLQTWMNQIVSSSYHRAGTAIWTIALVVAVMDYLSARLREKLV
jgi:phosphonate transport system permease protein